MCCLVLLLSIGEVLFARPQTDTIVVKHCNRNYYIERLNRYVEVYGQPYRDRYNDGVLVSWPQLSPVVDLQQMENVKNLLPPSKRAFLQHRRIAVVIRMKIDCAFRVLATAFYLPSDVFSLDTSDTLKLTIADLVKLEKYVMAMKFDGTTDGHVPDNGYVMFQVSLR